MKLWRLNTLLVVLLVLFSACSGGKPKPKEEQVDKSLAMVKLTKKGTIVGMKAIAFEWESIKDPRVQGVYIYKSSSLGEKEDMTPKLYETLNNRFTTHFVDQDIEPDTQYNYEFSTFSKEAYGQKSQTITVNSLPVLHSVSWIYSVTGMPRMAKLLWRPHSNQKVKAYIIERRTLKDEQWENLATINGRLSAEYIDTDLKDNYVYKYRIRVKTYDDIISTPSQIVKVVTKPLPKSIKNIKATKNLPKLIKITWESSANKDFRAYRLYKSDELNDSYDLIATLTTTSYTDKIDADGKSYFYRVSVVDKDGLESVYSKVSIQGMTLTKPQTPGVVKAKLINNKQIELAWTSRDTRVKSFTITKNTKQGWFDKVSEDIEGITETKFVDKAIKPDTKYSYIVRSVDENGIMSDESMEVEIITQEQAKEIIEVENLDMSGL